MWLKGVSNPSKHEKHLIKNLNSGLLKFWNCDCGWKENLHSQGAKFGNPCFNSINSSPSVHSLAL
uniref:Uncharacterized protein n=1 Tax=Anguilla anguilla TaxID=7936 RepID=A0A0E9XKL1_ANGAN